MRVASKALFTFLAFAFCLSVISAAQQAGQLKSMKLLTADTGWAATDKNLFWTADGGAHWREITPKLKHKTQIVSSVFFLDASTGWVLFTCADDRDIVADDSCFDLASTTNAGNTWSLVHEGIVEPLSKEQLEDRGLFFSGQSWLSFVDAKHGWEILKIATGSGPPSAGEMLRTADGGKTWVDTKELPFPDHFRFVTPRDGWIAGGDDGELFVTHDAGDSWQKVSVPEPAGLGQHMRGNYGLPIFETDRRGFTWAQYTTGPPEGPNEEVLTLLATDDGGKSWRQKGMLAGLPDIHYAEVVDRTLLAANSKLVKEPQGEGQCPSRRIAVSLFSIGPDRRNSHTVGSLPLPDGPIAQLSFMNRERGWTIALGRLFGTQNGGKNWTELTPGGPPHELKWVCGPSASEPITRDGLQPSGLSLGHPH